MLTVSVISPEAVLYEGTTDSVVAPAYDGEVGILTGHAPMMTLLGEGRASPGRPIRGAPSSMSKAAFCRSSTTMFAS